MNTAALCLDLSMTQCPEIGPAMDAPRTEDGSALSKMCKQRCSFGIVRRLEQKPLGLDVENNGSQGGSSAKKRSSVFSAFRSWAQNTKIS